MAPQFLTADGDIAPRTTEVFGYPLPPEMPGRKPIQHSADQRYLLPDPDTGKPGPRTRMTTLVHALDDDFQLSRWQRRMWAVGGYRLGFDDASALEGAGGDVAQAFARSAAIDDGVRAIQDEVADTAEIATEMDRASEFGTAVHEWCAWVDLGYPLIDVPDTDACVLNRVVKGDEDADGKPRVYASRIRDRVADYLRVRGEMGLTPLPEWIERTVWVRVPTTYDYPAESIPVVGTLDRLMMDSSGRIGLYDIKTSATIEYSYNSWTAQLTGYTTSYYVLDMATHEWSSALDTDLDKVDHIAAIQLPSTPAAGAEHPVPVVTSLNMHRGRELLALAATMRIEKRKARARDLALDAAPVPVDTTSDAYLRARIISDLQRCATREDASAVYLSHSSETHDRLGTSGYAAWLAGHLPE